jgi:hypothetical protein
MNWTWSDIACKFRSESLQHERRFTSSYNSWSVYTVELSVNGESAARRIVFTVQYNNYARLLASRARQIEER